MKKSILKEIFKISGNEYTGMADKLRENMKGKWDLIGVKTLANILEEIENE